MVQEMMVSDEPSRVRTLPPRLPQLVGILNVTPDSFYDGGRYMDAAGAIRRGLEMFSQGAAWVDVGGMSTRPGSSEISLDEEIARVEPVIAGLAKAIRSQDESRHSISVDTYRAKVAERAVAAGAACINDVSGFSLDPGMLAFAARSGCLVVINHMKGVPLTMQIDPRYDSLWEELTGFFESRLDAFVRAGGRESNVLIDPGIGFGKTLENNIDILKGLDRLRSLGPPIFLGCSRKSFIEKLFPGTPPDLRLPGSLAAAAVAAMHQVDFLRVHDVADTAQFLKVFLALRS